MADNQIAAPVAVVGSLARSCHPGPTVAVTCFSIVLAVSAGTGPGIALLMGAAVLTGQLSIGWSNDRIDRERDRTVGRTDKPIATGELSVRTIDVALVVAVAATVVLSLLLGWRAGVVHLAAVACGWIYNLGMKSTWWSWLPYAAAFGALPAVAVLASPGHPAPGWWAVLAGALLGITGNLTNPLPELAEDEQTGIRGVAHRIGARPALAIATVLVIAATALLVIGPRGATPIDGWLAFAAVAIIALIGLAVAWRRPTAHVAFYGIIAVVAVDIVLLALVGRGLR